MDRPVRIARPKKKKSMIIEKVEDCPRCGETHYGLDFKRLVRPIEHCNYWASCPSIGQPIIMFEPDELEEEETGV